MKNNAMKSTPVADNFEDSFPWTRDECQALGVDRQLSHLAWNVLNGDSEATALASSGYSRFADFRAISCRPEYLRAVRVMAAQFLNAVAFPRAVLTLLSISRDRSAMPAARVKASNVLMDYAVSTLQAFKDELDKGHDDMSPEAIAKVIKHLETSQADALADVQIDVQMTEQEDYLSDMS